MTKLVGVNKVDVIRNANTLIEQAKEIRLYTTFQKKTECMIVILCFLDIE